MKDKPSQLPTEEELINNLKFLGFVIIQARSLARHKAPIEQLEDLMDVVHNLPEGLLNWDEWKTEYFLAGLKYYDEKWHSGMHDLGRTYQKLLMK